jgi:hypothetical protein
VVAVNLGKPFSHNQPKPEEERQLRVGQIAGKFRDCVREPVLEHVRWIYPPANTSVQTGLDHPP